MPEIDDCEYCSSSKRLRRTCVEGNNNNNNNELTEFVTKEVHECIMPVCLQILVDMPPINYREQLEHGWNPLDASINVDVKLMDPLTLHRHPVAQSSDGIRGRMGFSSGVHVWRITWRLNERGTHAVIGVCTQNSGLHCHGYCSLIGADNCGWGWDIVRRRLVHDGRDMGSYGDDDHYSSQEQILVMLDMDVGTLAFCVGDKYLGVAFTGLNNSKQTVYPAVSAVWGHCEVAMLHLASLHARPVSLLQLCRFSIRKHLNLSPSIFHNTSHTQVVSDLSYKMQSLDIPEYLKQYIKTGSFRR